MIILQLERRNAGQKMWSESLIYWCIRQMTRWCAMYTGDCPSTLAHTYEWTLRFVWMLSVSSSDLSTGWCTSPHHICYEYWLIAPQLFPSSKNCHQLNGRCSARRSPECVWGSVQWQTRGIYKRLPFCQGGTASDTMHAPQLVILYSSN